MKVLRYVVVLGLLGIPLGILGRLIYLDGYYYANAPRVADSVAGAIVPVIIHHGTTVFLTQKEWYFFQSPAAEMVQFIAFVFGASVAFVLNRRWRVAAAMSALGR